MKVVRFSLLLAVALLSHVVFAQDQTPPRFALEVSQSGMAQPYMLVPEHGESWTFLFARSLFAREQSSFDESRASALKLVFRLEQDTVKLTASAYFGRFDTNNTPQSLEGLRQEPVSRFSLRLGESVALQESETFGFGPVNIKLVSATPEQPLNPQIVSKVPSIQVELVSQTRAGYQVSIRNTASRAVLAYAVSSSLSDEDGSSMESGVGNSQPVLTPGAVSKQTSFCVPPINGRHPQPCDFVLQSALFEDGTYEGDPKYAAHMETRRLATDILQRRVHELIDSAIKDTTLDDAGRVTLLRAQFQALPDSPDKATEEAILKQLQAKFPSLPQDFSGRAFRFPVLSVFRREKTSLLRSLNDYPNYLQSWNSRPRKLPAIPLSEWLARHSTMGITSAEQSQPDLHKK